MASSEFLLFDVGNTRVKSGVFRDGRLEQFSFCETAAESIALMVETFDLRNCQRRVALATVNGAVADQLRAQLQQSGTDADLVLRSDGGLFRAGFLSADLETPTTVGVDRLLSAIAARHRAPATTVLVVDCGSAITVNLTTAEGTFRGGAILPGVRLAAQSLQQGTFALPKVAVERPATPLGRSTEAAIRAGVYFGLAGAIDRLLWELVNRAPAAGNPWEVFVTGGDAGLLARALRTPHQVVDALVLEGLGLVAERSLG
jgi:type III pantothenate kinase